MYEKYPQANWFDTIGTNAPAAGKNLRPCELGCEHTFFFASGLFLRRSISDKANGSLKVASSALWLFRLRRSSNAGRTRLGSSTFANMQPGSGDKILLGYRMKNACPVPLHLLPVERARDCYLVVSTRSRGMAMSTNYLYRSITNDLQFEKFTSTQHPARAVQE